MPDETAPKKIGVFVCHCGSNIAGTVDVEAVAQKASELGNVVFATDYKYMCSKPGQDLVRQKIKEKGLDSVVVCACSPKLHEPTFRKACAQAGLNEFCLEMANIREQCSWIHQDDKAAATEKAHSIISMAVAKARSLEALEMIEVDVTKRALVIGGGIAGIQAALDIADSGYEVILVEKEPSIGGHMAQLSETFPTLDCSQCILTPKMVAAGSHPNIKIMPYAEVEKIDGYVGNFKATIKTKAHYVDWDTCTGCGICQEKCPAKVDSEFERGLGKRKAIYTPFPQAVPNKPVLDRENCLYFKTGACRLCEKNCEPGAIDYEQEDQVVEEEIGAIVVATGYELYPILNLGEYGAGEIPDVVDGLAFERLLSASGPTSGIVSRPSDGKVPESVVFIQCAGSRDPENHKPYCSNICCMYTTKHAMLYKHSVHNGQPYIFYIDIRSPGKGYEEFVERGQEEGIQYIRGKVSKIYQNGDKVRVMGVDTLLGEPVEIDADMVVLAMAVEPHPSAAKLGMTLKMCLDTNGFFSEAHPKLRPVETVTAGIYLAGCSQAPRDIPETVAQASGAASKVSTLFANDRLSLDPTKAVVDEDLCCGCGVCVGTCDFKAIELVREMRDGEEKVHSKINEALCQGCGSCVAACPSSAIDQRGFKSGQIEAMIHEAV